MIVNLIFEKAFRFDNFHVKEILVHDWSASHGIDHQVQT
jgi:hypothetical protein